MAGAFAEIHRVLFSASPSVGEREDIPFGAGPAPAPLFSPGSRPREGRHECARRTSCYCAESQWYGYKDRARGGYSDRRLHYALELFPLVWPASATSAPSTSYA